MKVYIHSYPFLPPVIQLNYKLNVELKEFSSDGLCVINSLKKENWVPSTSIYLQILEIKKIFEEKNIIMDDRMVEYRPFIEINLNTT
jgi:ubiquitin-protein ligase